MPLSLLIVEDEAAIRDLLDFTFSRAGYEVITADTAEQALRLLKDQIPNLAIIDWMLPGMSGLDLTHLLRGDALTSNLPIIMLTARGDEPDKLQSFANGVDDYITKPFSPKELLARTKALLRRTSDMQENRLSIAGIEVDLATYQVSLDNQPIEIGATEYRLLTLLMRHPDRVFTRDNLIDKIWGQNTAIETRTVDVHILRLRKLLKPHNLQDLIHTVRGIGYRFSNRKA